MSKHVGITSSISTEDPYPEYSFFVYDDDTDQITINREAELQEYYRLQRKKRKRLGLDDLDRLSAEELEEWYESNDRSHLIN